MRSGLIPALQSGFMVGAGSSWRIATMRPGEDPIGHLTTALDAADVLGANEELGDTSRILLEVTLRRSTLGLVEAVRQARLPAGDNVLVIVDQFEELFRFRDSRRIANSRDEAIGFVKLLLEAAGAADARIYVVLTMRSDFIGDCMDFPGLPEAVNAGLYLVGRMTREGLRAAITGPVAVAEGDIAPRLVNRVLNDLGDDHDQLPLVQHALMRTWDHWATVQGAAGVIDIDDYEAVGTFRDALSKHAEEAYEEASARGHGRAVERIFKALTDTFTDPRGVRRPTSVAELAAICEVTSEVVIEVVDVFRHPGRSFLMPPAAVPLTERSIVDLSHESLMRCWGRLIAWADEERAAAAFYVRLSQAATWYEQGTAGLWRDPELQLAQRWRDENRPTPAWAHRYDPGFARAMAFLDSSLAERERQHLERQRERRAKLRRTQAVAAVLAAFLVVSIGLGLFAWSERQRAQGNLALAREAVDESLAAAERDPAAAGADVPQVEELRRELLAKAERFYTAFLSQEPRSDEARRDLALAHLRLGHINRMLEKRGDAEREYRAAIEGLGALSQADTENVTDRDALSSAFNWLGETLRVQMGRQDEAAAAYDRALQVQRDLVAQQPGTGRYQEELARTLSNRGILRSSSDAAAAEEDFREALALLEPLTSASAQALQEMGRVSNNLAALLDTRGASDAREQYERAVKAHEALVQQHPDQREYKLELATFYNNLAMFLHARDASDEAAARNDRALALITELARPAPSLAIERADAHNLRGVILQARNMASAERAFQESLDLFREMDAAPGALAMRQFHIRFSDLLLNLALLVGQPGASANSRALLSRGLDQYAAIAKRAVASGDRAQARVIYETLATVMQELAPADRSRLLPIQEQLARVME